jgi:phosphoglucosamine mutase
MKRYPQVAVNIKTSHEGKLSFYTDKVIEAKIVEIKEILASGGRIVVRPSGTEPLIRVMVEGPDTETITTLANNVADVIRERLASK